MKSSTSIKTNKYPYIFFIAILYVLLMAYCFHQSNSIRLNGTGVAKPAEFILAKACSNSGTCIDKVVLMQGEVTQATYSQFLDFVKNLPEEEGRSINHLCFDSPGGNNESGIPMGLSLSKAGINTCIADRYFSLSDNSVIKPLFKSKGELTTRCNSICPIIFMSGKERIMLGDTAKFGFHSSKKFCKVCGFSLFEYKDMDSKEQFLATFREYESSGSRPLNMAEAMMDRTFEIAPSKIAYMTKEQLRDFNVVTQFN